MGAQIFKKIGSHLNIMQHEGETKQAAHCGPHVL